MPAYLRGYRRNRYHGPGRRFPIISIKCTRYQKLLLVSTAFIHQRAMDELKDHGTIPGSPEGFFSFHRFIPGGIANHPPVLFEGPYAVLITSDFIYEQMATILKKGVQGPGVFVFGRFFSQEHFNSTKPYGIVVYEADQSARRVNNVAAPAVEGPAVAPPAEAAEPALGQPEEFPRGRAPPLIDLAASTDDEQSAEEQERPQEAVAGQHVPEQSDEEADDQQHEPEQSDDEAEEAGDEMQDPEQSDEEADESGEEQERSEESGEEAMEDHVEAGEEEGHEEASEEEGHEEAGEEEGHEEASEEEGHEEASEEEGHEEAEEEGHEEAGEEEGHEEAGVEEEEPVVYIPPAIIHPPVLVQNIPQNLEYLDEDSGMPDVDYY